MEAPIKLYNARPSLPTVSSEMAKEKPPSGYPQIADIMSKYPELTMFRRFKGLNALNLLYLQAELMQIEKDLQDLQKADNITNSKYAADYSWLMASAETENDQQWRLIQKMNKKLKEYNDVLIQLSTLSQTPNPTAHDRTQMQNWYESRMPLLGVDDKIWAEPGRVIDGEGVSKYAQDLIAIHGQTSDYDRFTAWLLKNIAAKLFPKLYRIGDEKILTTSRKEILTFEENAFIQFTSIVATLLSALLPILSIVILYLVKSIPARLGIIAAFTAGFSIVLSIITSGSRIETFAATAAFAAVQVVFVGSNGNSTAMTN